MLKNKKILFAGVPVVLIILILAVVLLMRLNRPHDPDSAFWTAMRTAMSTSGVTCTIDDNTDGRISTQAVSLDLRGKMNATSQTTIKQNGSTVVTQGISTANADFVRYTNITSQKRDATGKPLNFSSVLNVWSKQSRSNSAASLFDQTALGGCVLPLGDLSQSKAESLVADMQKNKVFTVQTDKATKASENGTAVYRYAVTVPPTRYVGFMKRFADEYGMKSLNSVAVSSYNGQAPQRITISVDSRRQRVTQISFSGQNHTIFFSNYGDRPSVQVPSKTIPVSQLQERLQSIK